MKMKQKMLRFFSIFLACIMIMNVPVSVLAYEDIMVMEVAEEVQIAAEEEFLSEEIIISEEEIIEETIEESIQEEISETEELVFDSSTEDVEDEFLFEDESPELGESIEIMDIEVLAEDTIILFSDAEDTDEDPFTVTAEGEKLNVTLLEGSEEFPEYSVEVPDGRDITFAFRDKILTQIGTDTNLEAVTNENGSMTVLADIIASNVELDSTGTYKLYGTDPDGDQENVMCIAGVTIKRVIPKNESEIREVIVPEGHYQVTVQVAPAEADVTFYYDSPATVQLTENNVYDDGIVDGYHQYTLVVEEGTYAYRAVEGEQSLGGMEFTVPIEDEYASDGTLMGKGQILSLKRVDFYTTNKNIANTDDYTVHLYPQDLSEAVCGSNYISEDGYVTAPIMVNAGGNTLTYHCFIDINGELGETYAVAPMANLTFSPGIYAEAKAFSVTDVEWYTITAPEKAKVQMFNQKTNYNVDEIPVSGTEKLENGMVKSFFATSGGQTITYRVSMQNKITRAGYTTKEDKDLVFEFKDYENPKSTATSAYRIENSSMLNINRQNNLKMSVGETFRLRSFRAGWQIINTDTENIMIEPDFHYNIVSGAEHITLTPAANKTTGNAGSGMNSNWMDITAVSAGTVVLEVSYDAIKIEGDTSYPGTFGAVDPSRKSVVVINIGASTENTLSVMPVQGDYEKCVWDADFDTVYFMEESAEFDFTATIGGGTPDRVELSTDLGRNWIEIISTEGIYHATGLTEGNNILRVTRGNLVEYQVVRASKLKASVVNMTRGGSTIIAGDKVRVIFRGIYTPVPKMSGIYNPGFQSVHKTVFTVPEGVQASSGSTQYGFGADNQLDITFSEAGTITLENGYITSSVLGDPLGGHRLLTDNGRGVNFNASGIATNRCIMPDLTFEVIDMPWIDVTVVSEPEGAEITITDEEGTIIEAKEDGRYSLECGTYFYKAVLDGYVPAKDSFTVEGDDRENGNKTVKISLQPVEGKIWDGESKVKPAQDENGMYLIGSGAELAWYADNHNGAGAKLTDDISLGGYGVTIQNLSAVFDGNGHYITDFYHSDALFAAPDKNTPPVIRNLGLSGEIQTTVSFVGSFVRASNNSAFTIENCVSRVQISGKGEAVSGIVGGASGSGIAYTPRIVNCYNTGRVYGNGGGFKGGIASVAGYDENPILNITNCYNIGSVNDYGVSRNGRGTIKNNYYLLGSASNTTYAVGSALTADELKSYASTLGDAYLDNPTSYNNGYPILAWEEPRALAVAVPELSAILENYKNLEDYRGAQQEELETAIENGKTAIAEAATLAEAKNALEAAKKVMDAVLTDAELPPAAEIYFSVSHDDKFVKAKNGEVMALKKITVPYFDLGLYGLEQYYFVSETYGKGDGATESNPSSNLKPGTAENAEGKVTMLHAFIYATEVYYCQVDPEDAGKGYLANLIGTDAFSPTGSTGSMYIKKFWGMDENFNYYHNYEYPLASEGWGSTADQILLKHGDIVTLGHFTSWDFHNDELSVFNYIKAGNHTIKTTAKQGDVVEATVMLAAKGGNYTTSHIPMAGRNVFITPVSEVSGNPREWQQVGTSDENGNVLIHTRDLMPGQYLVATPGAHGQTYTDDICSTPGGILLTIKDNTQNINKVTAVENMIMMVPDAEDLTLSNAEMVEAARTAYEALTAKQKTMVYESILSKLEEAEAKITSLKKAETDAAEAQTAANVIAALPAANQLTTADAETVATARAAYEALTDDQKALVSAEILNQLEAAEAKIAELKKAEEDAQKPQQHVHSWDAGTVTKPATCKETGVKTFKCSCGETKTETIAITTSHQYGAWTTVSEATVKAAEVQKRICSVCGKEETKNVGEALTPVLEIPGKLSSFNMKKGKTAKFEVTMANGDSVSSVKSSKTKILKATLDKKTGKITVKGVKKGTSKLTITLASGKTRTYTVKVVTGTVKTKGLSVTNVTDKKLTLAVKKTHTLQSELKPFTSTQKLTYKSSNKKIAKVSSKGKITAVAPGKATITVTSGSKKVKITVTVPGIANVKSSVSVKKNKTLTLKPKTYGISEKVTYTSSNTKVATVTANGKIKGIKKGTAKITVKAGTYTKTVTVKVK